MSHRRRHGSIAAVVLATLFATHAAAAGLPRVFLSPSERAALTASRLSGRLPLPAAEAAAAAPLAARGAPEPAAPVPAPTTPRTARVEGITFGAGTTQAAWIGGERIADGGRWAGHRVRVMRDGVQLVARDGSVRQLRVGMEALP